VQARESGSSLQVEAGMAEADGNRTRLAEMLGHVGFEDRGGHQAPLRLHGEGYRAAAVAVTAAAAALGFRRHEVRGRHRGGISD
jgi:hypothetical protein